MVTTGRSAAFFDLDKTLIAVSSALAFSGPFYRNGLIGRRDVLRSAYASVLFRATGAGHDRMDAMQRHLSELVRGWPIEKVRRIVADELPRLIVPAIYPEARALIAEHRRAGRDVVIVSSSGSDIVEQIGELLGVDTAIGTRMVSEGGRYTGEIEFYAYGEGKAEAIRDLAAARGYDLRDCFAYSDSVTDVPMLEAVGHPTAVNADAALRRVAAERGWPTLDFKRPVIRDEGVDPRWIAVAVIAALVVTAAVAGAAHHRLARTCSAA
jgi:HAD superfamily hydrolase (TIGR01490 family)